MLAIQMRGCDGGDEELAAVGVGAAVCHAEQAWLVVAKLEVLIRELATIDGFTSTAITSGEVSALKHEIRDHAMEEGALVMQGLALRVLAHAHLTSAELQEVVRCFGDDIRA